MSLCGFREHSVELQHLSSSLAHKDAEAIKMEFGYSKNYKRVPNDSCEFPAAVEKVNKVAEDLVLASCACFVLADERTDAVAMLADPEGNQHA